MLLLAGCATSSEFGDVEKVLPDQLGYMIYEEAVEYYGKPDRVAQLSGGRFMAEWIREGVVITERLKLTFDSNQIMRAYDFSKQPFE